MPETTTKPLFIRISKIGNYFPWSKDTAYRDAKAGLYKIHSIAGRSMVEIAEVEQVIREGKKS